jgi:hypothetical protein
MRAADDDGVPGSGARNRYRKGKRVTELVAARAPQAGLAKTRAAIKGRPVTGADVQWLVYHRNIRLTE